MFLSIIYSSSAINKEAHMPIDKIVILVMALAFLGAIAFVCWKTRQQEKSGRAASSVTPDRIEEDSSNISKKKERRISKS
jgi:hypothetical protein